MTVVTAYLRLGELSTTAAKRSWWACVRQRRSGGFCLLRHSYVTRTLFAGRAVRGPGRICNRARHNRVGGALSPLARTMSSLFSTLFQQSPSLPSTGDEPLFASTSPEGTREKCELQIEGMTCGSCVAVSQLALTYRHIHTPRSRSREYSKHNLAYTL